MGRAGAGETGTGVCAFGDAAPGAECTGGATGRRFFLFFLAMSVQRILRDVTRGIRVLFAALSGLVLFAANEPLALGPLAWIALVPLLVAVVSEDRLRWSWLYGIVFGIVYFGTDLSWISIFGWMAWTALIAWLALEVSVATLLAGVVRRASLAPVLIAGAFAGVELWRDRWPYGGFPWGAVGTTQGDVPIVRYLAGTIGVYGLGFLCVFFAAIVAHRIVHNEIAWSSIAAVVSVLVVSLAIDVALYHDKPEGKPVRMAVVQGGVPRPVLPDQRDVILADHIAETRKLLAHDEADVIVWPEDSVGIGVSDGAVARVQALAREFHTPILFGHSIDEGPREPFVNQVQHIAADGTVLDTYQKRHPVPFGEYVPISFLRRYVSTLSDQVPFNQTPGRTANVFVVDGVKIATPICFESVFPRDFIDFERRGAQLFVLSTNNASFEHSYAAKQHLAQTRMRALEMRQWVVQDALAGISAVISPSGRVTHTTKLFTTAGFVVTVRARAAQSLYDDTGDLFPSIWAALTGLAVLWIVFGKGIGSRRG
jgi:apolipoprotein N-acyltransferase